MKREQRAVRQSVSKGTIHETVIFTTQCVAFLKLLWLLTAPSLATFASLDLLRLPAPRGAPDMERRAQVPRD